ncbi:MAG: alpha/beta hydrolase [Opitutaceae bacterium]|nr:alpha/beta hydrolase [Opitutaceae bacterium]
MKAKRPLPRAVLLATLTLATLALSPSSTLAQAARKKGKGAADPEGQPPRRALPASVKVERDIVYARYGAREVKLDLYLPKQPAAAKIPCVVVVHGGGWRSGDKTRFAHIAGALAEQGFAAACIGYRLLPEVEFPAPVLDCKAAVRWVRGHAAQHGLDPDRIGAIGGSAGGHLVAMLGVSDTVASLEGEGGNAGVSSRVHAVVAMATPADMTRMGDRQSLGDDLAKLISPVMHVTKDSAPMLLLHGTKDTLVPMAQSELLLEKYRQAGARAELVKIEDGVHAFWNGVHFDQTMQLALKFFRDALPATPAPR